MGSFQRIGYRNDNNKVRKVGLRCCVVLILLSFFFGFNIPSNGLSSYRVLFRFDQCRC